MKNRTIFNFGRNNRLFIAVIVSDDDVDKIVGRWISGRILGRYISIYVPLFRPKTRG